MQSHHKGVLWTILKLSSPSATLLVSFCSRLKKTAFYLQSTLGTFNHDQKCLFSRVPTSSLSLNLHQLEVLNFHT